jgi:hypothetical protein
MYGRDLPAQNGAPLRLVVPWKYGFKSIKSIVSIRLQETQPETTWSVSAPSEYGFYANVNPAVDHPRWSQKRERRNGEIAKRETRFLNGYAEQVAPLYFWHGSSRELSGGACAVRSRWCWWRSPCSPGSASPGAARNARREPGRDARAHDWIWPLRSARDARGHFPASRVRLVVARAVPAHPRPARVRYCTVRPRSARSSTCGACETLVEDNVERPYITAGFTGFLLLPCLSRDHWTLRLGAGLGRRWSSHRRVYAAAVAASPALPVAQKADIPEPLVYFGILACLFPAVFLPDPQDPGG